LKNISNTKKGQRKYAHPQGTLFNHPTRISILETLQQGKKTTNELEQLIGENRVNLYHHLNILENEALIISEINNRQKYFELNNNSIKKQHLETENLFLSLNISNNKEKKEKFINLLNELLNISENKPPLMDNVSNENLTFKKVILELD
jgi:DNA-binding transcriptional ArsR family regulator